MKLEPLDLRLVENFIVTGMSISGQLLKVNYSNGTSVDLDLKLGAPTTTVAPTTQAPTTTTTAAPTTTVAPTTTTTAAPTYVDNSYVDSGYLV